MPRLRNTNRLITHWSQISLGDKLVYHNPHFDIIGTVQREHRYLILVQESGIMHRIAESKIRENLFMKIREETYDRIKSEFEQYRIVADTCIGFRTGLFPCRD